MGTSQLFLVPGTVLQVMEDEMHLLDQALLGIAILVLLGMLVVVKQVTTGAILDRPKGNLLVQVVNVFNLFFLLVVNPVAALLLIMRQMATTDPTHFVIDQPWALTILEAVGLLLYVTGFLLMAWALLILRRNYQLGGSVPRAEDNMVMDGPYRLIRHPMYASALSIALGLSCLVQSWAFFAVFCIYLVLMLPLIRLEEAGLRTAYGERYAAYQQKTKRLVPFVY